MRIFTCISDPLFESFFVVFRPVYFQAPPPPINLVHGSYMLDMDLIDHVAAALGPLACLDASITYHKYPWGGRPPPSRSSGWGPRAHVSPLICP